MTKTKSMSIFLCMFQNFLCISKNWWPLLKKAWKLSNFFGWFFKYMSSPMQLSRPKFRLWCFLVHPTIHLHYPYVRPSNFNIQMMHFILLWLRDGYRKAAQKERERERHVGLGMFCLVKQWQSTQCCENIYKMHMSQGGKVGRQNSSALMTWCGPDPLKAVKALAS